MIKRYKIPRLALGLVGHLILSIIISVFSFGFLYTTSYGIAEKLALSGNYGDIDDKILDLLEATCLIGAVVVFLVMFLYLIGQKLSYILELNKAIQQLEGGNLGYRIAVEGEDELSELAANLNHLAQTLQVYRQNEEKLETERIELIQSLSHDIRTPLTAILSYTDFIKEKRYDSPEKLENYIYTIQKKAYQIKELTQLLFDAQQPIRDINENETFDGKVLLTQLMHEYEGILEDEDFCVVSYIENLESFNTRINPQDLVRVFDNLCSNIIKYADQSEKVVFEIGLEEQVLTIIQRNIVKVVESKNVESYGIGLKNIKQIVDKYNGNIKVGPIDKDYTIEIRFYI